MSSQDINQVSARTGSYAVLSPAPVKAQGGNSEAKSGNKLPEPPKPDLEGLARELNIASQTIGRDLRFRVDMESGRSVIQVLDRETGEIVRQIPPENAKTYVSELGEVALRLYDNQV
tara:strand:- start:632 stop:982 length:351 start_codon:yes stop_codon:yes gene_type:complete